MTDITRPDDALFPRARVLRTVAVVLVLVQSLVLVGFAVAWLVSLVRGTAVYPQAVIGLAVVALAGAGMLALCARGAWRAAAWTRAPIVTFQLLLGIMGVEWIRGGTVAVGALAVGIAVVVVVAMVWPGVVARRGPVAAD